MNILQLLGLEIIMLGGIFLLAEKLNIIIELLRKDKAGAAQKGK